MQNSLLDLIVPTVYRYLDKIETSTEKEIPAMENHNYNVLFGCLT